MNKSDSTQYANLLEITNLIAGYGGGTVINGLSVEVAKGSVVAIIGPNGVGKTTLLRSIVGLLKPRSGDIRYKGAGIASMAPAMTARAGISMVPEGRRIFTRLSVAENLAIGAQSRGRGFDATKRRDYLLGYFHELEPLLGRKGGALSGGQQQMLAIARALMSEPDLLLIDEASLGLAPIIIKRMAALLRDLRQQLDLTVLLVEQGAALASMLADKIHVMSNGSLLSGNEAEYDDLVREYTSYGGLT